MRRPGPLPVGFICLLAALATSVGAPTAARAHAGLEGRLDPSFGHAGIAYSHHFLHVARSRYRWLFREPDGDLLVAGPRQTSGEAESEGVLTALLPSGKSDRGFGEGGELIFGSITAAAQGPGGEIILAGDLAGSCPGNSSILRLEPDGRADPAFGTEGCTAAPFVVTNLAVGGAGQIVLAGQVTYGQPMRDLEIQRQLSLAALLPDGRSDQSFGVAGIVHARDEDGIVLSAPQSLAITDGGTILISGAASEVAGFSGKATELIAFAANGSPDAGFGSDGTVLLPGRSLTILAGPGEDITVATGAVASECCTSSRLRLTRLLPDGRPDTTFAPGGSVLLAGTRYADPAALSPTPEGGYLIAASLSSPGCSNHCLYSPALLRTTSSGSLDPAYGDGGIVFPRAPEAAPIEARAPVSAALALGPEGQAFLSGGTYGGGAFLFARGAGGGALASFGRKGYVAETHTVPGNAEPKGLAIDPDGRLFVPAEGETGGVNSESFVLAFRRNGAVDSGSPSAEGILPVPSLERPLPGILARASAIYGLLTGSRPTVVRIGLGDTAPSYGEGGRVDLPPSFAPRKLLAAPGGGLLVVGRIRGRPGFAAVRIGRRGRIDRSYGKGGIAFGALGPARYSQVAASLIEPDGALIVAGDSRGSATAMRLTPSGRPDPSFGHEGRVRLLGTNTTATALALEEGRIVIAARHETATTKSGSILIALEHDGTRDPHFGTAGVANPSGATTPLGLFADDGDLLLVAALGEARGGVMVRDYRPDGRPQRSFGSHGRILAARDQARLFHPVAAGLQPDGRLVVVGEAGSWLVGNRTELLGFR